ncbi:MAG: hypothetical protein QG608_204 [Actinomycetota bacterium]|nr:hypothetical protein [Actinomycetota bacterium]
MEWMKWVVGALLAVIVVAVAVVTPRLFRSGLVVVTAGRVGVIRKRWGRQHPDDDGLDVKIAGSPGPQARILRPNSRTWLPPVLYSVEQVEQVFVPPGTIGLVEAKAGRIRPPSRSVGRYVECNYFQDGATFLRAGGEQGPQLGVLPGGSRYSINPTLFDVVTVDTIRPGRPDGLTAASLQVIEVKEGTAGVVIVQQGSSPPEGEHGVAPIIPGHDHFQLPWVFLAQGGRRGVQQETLGSGGRYAINPWFVRVVLVPTRMVQLNWTRRESKSPSNLDSALDQIQVDIEGYVLNLELSQVLHIPPDAAPRLVRQFGETETPDHEGQATGVTTAPVQRFVRDVLSPVVAGYFTEIVAKYKVREFIEEYDEVKLQLQDLVTTSLAQWGVIAGETSLGDFTPANDDPAFYELRREVARSRQQGELLQQERQNATVRKEIELIAIALKTARKTGELKALIDILGPDQVSAERLSEILAKAQVPTTMVGTNAADQLLPSQVILNLLQSMTSATTPAPPAAIDDEETRVIVLPSEEIPEDGQRRRPPPPR